MGNSAFPKYHPHVTEFSSCRANSISFGIEPYFPATYGGAVGLGVQPSASPDTSSASVVSRGLLMAWAMSKTSRKRANSSHDIVVRADAILYNPKQTTDNHNLTKGDSKIDNSEQCRLQSILPYVHDP